MPKVDRFGYVRRAMHGTRMLSRSETFEQYGRNQVDVDLRDERWSFLNTLFSVRRRRRRGLGGARPRRRSHGLGVFSVRRSRRRGIGVGSTASAWHRRSHGLRVARRGEQRGGEQRAPPERGLPCSYYAYTSPLTPWLC